MRVRFKTINTIKLLYFCILNIRESIINPISYLIKLLIIIHYYKIYYIDNKDFLINIFFTLSQLYYSIAHKVLTSCVCKLFVTLTYIRDYFYHIVIYKSR